jgi:penicillin amidase
MLGATVLVVLSTVTPVSATPRPTVVYPVSGLDKPAELVIDKWGVPHLFARDTGDLFLAQGFNAARDRLFQIDLLRRFVTALRVVPDLKPCPIQCQSTCTRRSTDSR